MFWKYSESRNDLSRQPCAVGPQLSNRGRLLRYLCVGLGQFVLWSGLKLSSFDACSMSYDTGKCTVKWRSILLQKILSLAQGRWMLKAPPLIHRTYFSWYSKIGTKYVQKSSKINNFDKHWAFIRRAYFLNIFYAPNVANLGF